MPNTVADIEQTPEDAAFVAEETARLAAREEGPLAKPDEGEDLAPIETEDKEPKEAKVEDKGNEGEADKEETAQPAVQEKVDPLLLLVQEQRLAREARERELAAWEQQQLAAKQQQQAPTKLADRTLDWHRQNAIKLGYDIQNQDPNVRRTEARAYEAYVHQQDTLAQNKQLETELNSIKQQAYQSQVAEAVNSTMTEHLNKFDLTEPAKARFLGMTHNLIKTGMDPNAALAEVDALIRTVSKPKQQQQQVVKPADRPGVRAAAIQGRGASRKPPTPSERLQASRSKIFGN